MLKIEWTRNKGWSTPVIEPLAPLQLHPCAQVLHYATECFEGMKAYKSSDGTLRLFRPDKNMNRLASSCQRLSLPTFDQEELLSCLKALVLTDAEFVPSKEGFSGYLRPTVVGTTPFLGVGPPNHALLFAVLSPVGPYFPQGLRPARLFLETENARAFPGGVGAYKVGGNYAPTIQVQTRAAALGCDQVLYALEDGHGDGPLIGESGAMNVFFLLGCPEGGMELVTPPLEGMILPGVTRDSVLQLARSWQEFHVSERNLRLSELEEAHAAGRLLEVFGCGTAVIIQPVSGILLKSGKELTVPYDDVAVSHWCAKPPGESLLRPAPGEPASLAARLYRSILDIQHGLVKNEWSVPIGQKEGLTN